MKNAGSVETGIPPSLTERVLTKLGFAAPPAADRAGLAALYAAWCERVPFDNTRKLISLREGAPGPLPGDSPVEFLEDWLADGSGGTCWAMHGAWTEVLSACGFRARRGIATMLVAPDLPPNHGTASVDLGQDTVLVDVCVQHRELLPLAAVGEARVAHPAYGVHVRPDGAKWLLRWRSPFIAAGPDGPSEMVCRIDSLHGDAAEFRALHEATRPWSPFNFQLFVRVHRHGGVLMAVRGERVFIDAAGAETRTPLEGDARLRFLVEEVGLREDFARRVPADVPTPPPPGSATARGVDPGRGPSSPNPAT